MRSQPPDFERFLKWADIGAARAAWAFSRLVDRPVNYDLPELRSESEGWPMREQGAWSTGVFFQFDGYLQACVGILFHQAASEALVRQVAGLAQGELDPHVIESALMEVGNILVSHVASAISDEVGDRLLPSIPILAMNHAESKMERWVSREGGLGRWRIDARLADNSGQLSGLLSMFLSRAA